MATFKITYLGEQEESEEVEADDYIDQDPWITFRKLDTTKTPPVQQVLRLRARDVTRIDRTKD